MGHIEGVAGSLVLEGHPHHHLGPQLPVHLLWGLQILHMHHSFSDNTTIIIMLIIVIITMIIIIVT